MEAMVRMETSDNPILDWLRELGDVERVALARRLSGCAPVSGRRASSGRSGGASGDAPGAGDEALPARWSLDRMAAAVLAGFARAQGLSVLELATLLRDARHLALEAVVCYGMRTLRTGTAPARPVTTDRHGSIIMG